MGDRLRELWRLWLVAAAWLGCARLLAAYGILLLPRDLARALGLHGYLGLVLVVSTAFGLAISRLLLVEPWSTLGLRRPKAGSVTTALLLSPIVLSLSAYLAFRLALPTLLAEIAEGGRQAAERNTGLYGRALIASHPALTLVWAVVLTPLAEELIFRGAVYEAIARLNRRRGPLAALWSHGPAIAITTAIFAFLHADQAGGAGIVRVVQAVCLGLALAMVRAHSGSLVAPMVLHALFNLMTIAKLRGYVTSPTWPPPLPIALWWWQLAAATAPVLVAHGLHRSARARALVLEGSLYVPRPPARVDVVVPTLPPPPRWLVAADEISCELEAEGDGSAVRFRMSLTLTSGLLRPLAGRFARKRARDVRAAVAACAEDP